MFSTDSIIPPDPEGLEVLHDREYRVRAYRLADDRLLLRGAVRDQKPPGLSMVEDPDPPTMHHMVVDLHVAFPSAEIVAAEVVFEAESPRSLRRLRSLGGVSRRREACGAGDRRST